jgi:hypothetical protein
MHVRAARIRCDANGGTAGALFAPSPLSIFNVTHHDSTGWDLASPNRCTYSTSPLLTFRVTRSIDAIPAAYSCLSEASADRSR